MRRLRHGTQYHQSLYVHHFCDVKKTTLIPINLFAAAYHWYFNDSVEPKYNRHHNRQWLNRNGHISLSRVIRRARIYRTLKWSKLASMSSNSQITCSKSTVDSVVNFPLSYLTGVKDLQIIRSKFCVELTNNKTLCAAVHVSRTNCNPLRFQLIPNDTDVKIVKSRYFLWVMKVVILIQFDAVQYCATSNSNRQPLLCTTFSLNTIAHFYRYEYIFPTRWKQSIDFEK